MKRRDFLTKSAAAIVAVPAVVVAGSELAPPTPHAPPEDDAPLREKGFDLYRVYRRPTRFSPRPFSDGEGSMLVLKSEYERIHARRDPAWTTVPPTPSDEA